MTHKNKKRNFLTKALATASVATLMLGVSNAVFASPDTRTANAVDAAFSANTSWAPNGPLLTGDLLKFSTVTPANGSIVADEDGNVMLDLNGISGTALTVTPGPVVTIGGIVNSGAPVATGLTLTVNSSTSIDGQLTTGVDTYTGKYGNAPGVAPGTYALLSAVNFTGTPAHPFGASIFHITTNNFISSVKFTNDVGSAGIIQLSATGIVLSSDIGTPTTPTNISIEAFPNSSSTFTGNIFGDLIVLYDNANLTLNGNKYQFINIRANVLVNDVILQFANGGEVSLEATSNSAPNAIGTLNVDGSTKVSLTGTGIKFQTLSFTSKAGTPMFTLPAGKAIGDYGITSITSAAGLSNIPELRFSGSDQFVSSGNTVGTDANNLVNFRFMDADNTTPRTFTVNQPNFFGQITTNVNGVGNALLNAISGKVYGLGEPGRQLATAKFTDNITNFGNTYVTNSQIANGWTVELGNTVAGTVTLGNGILTNGAILNLRDQVSLVGNIAAFAGTIGNSTVNFLGSANQIGNIGSKADEITTINFNGPVGSVANFNNNSNIYSTIINFKNTAINVTKGNVTINGTSNVNANIALGTSQLTFQSGDLTSTFGTNTSISTNVFKVGDATTPGSINVNTTIKVADSSNILVTPTLASNLPLDFKATVVSVGTGGLLDMNTSNSSIKLGTIFGTPNAYAKYDIVSTANNNVISQIDIVSANNAKVIVQQDFATAGITDPTDIANAAILISATSGDALTFVTKTGLITDPAARVNAYQRLTNSNNTQIAAAVSQGLLLGSDIAIIKRVSDTALQVNRNELGEDAPKAAGECTRVVGAPMGAWLTPVYSQASQKARGGNPGYKVKSGGAILGLDTEANDNMIIGAAATVLSSDLKMKDYKAGDKSKINSFMISLYGAQELVRDFFVQGVASFSTSKIKGKERRLVPTSINANGYETAHANYNSIGFGGQVLLGYNAKPREGVFVTPVAGVRYSKINDEPYRETGTTYQNKWVSKKSVNKVDAIFGIQVETNVQKQGGAIVPEAHAYITRKLSGKTGQVQSSLSGLPGEFVTRNDTTGKTFYNVGLGAKVMSGQMEYGAGYDAYLAPKYVAHQGGLKVRVNF